MHQIITDVFIVLNQKPIYTLGQNRSDGKTVPREVILGENEAFVFARQIIAAVIQQQGFADLKGRNHALGVIAETAACLFGSVESVQSEQPVFCTVDRAVAKAFADFVKSPKDVIAEIKSDYAAILPRLGAEQQFDLGQNLESAVRAFDTLRGQHGSMLWLARRTGGRREVVTQQEMRKARGDGNAALAVATLFVAQRVQSL